MFSVRHAFPIKTTLGLIITAALALLVLRAKGQLANVGYLFIALVSLAGTFMGGLLIGLIFVAFLTSQPDHTFADSPTDQIPAGAAY